MLPFGLSSEDLKESSSENISKKKFSLFLSGTTAKSKFQRVRAGRAAAACVAPVDRRALAARRGAQDKEERERKKREADAAAAQVYEQFVASFDTSGAAAKPFVRAGERPKERQPEAPKCARCSRRARATRPTHRHLARAGKRPPPARRRPRLRPQPSWRRAPGWFASAAARWTPFWRN